MRRMLHAALAVSLGSDDPAYFGGTLDRNYLDPCAALGLGGSAADRMARNGLTYSFAGAEEKQRLVERLHGMIARSPRAGKAAARLAS